MLADPDEPRDLFGMLLRAAAPVQMASSGKVNYSGGGADIERGHERPSHGPKALSTAGTG
jgi:hypothetical protein